MDRSSFIAENLTEVFAQRIFPTITYWNRLEARPRTDNFERALRAEVRDALWMLCKQWQMGEFRGDDAGSPVFSKVHMAHTRLTKYRPGADLPVQHFDDDTPLEAKVEQRPIPFNAGSQKMTLDLRLQLGRQWLKMLAKAVADGEVGGDYTINFSNKFSFIPPNPLVETDALVCAHREVWQQFAAVAGRSMDGAAFLEYLTAHPANWMNAIAAQPGDEPALKNLAQRFVGWFKKIYLQPQ
ncbi:MAG: hypothetical protein ABIQ93_05560, partial [Saprospiraceae bacterium]